MATISTKKPSPPVEIKKFLGLNENPDGDIGLKLGEASKMNNFRITPSYQLKKREGYKTVCSLSSGKVQGMWHGKLNGIEQILFAHGGNLYSASKQVTLSNLVSNGNFDSGTTGYYATNSTGSLTGHIYTFTASATNGLYGINPTELINGHVYYISGKVKSTSNLVNLCVAGLFQTFHTGDNTTQRLSNRFTWNLATSNVWTLEVMDNRTSGWNSVQMSELITIDLTAKYGAGNEPDKATIDAIVNSSGWFLTHNTSVNLFESVTTVGTLTDAKTSFIPFGNKVYLNNGYEYKLYDGTTFQTVAGYIPKIAVGTPYSGGGTDYEQINVLTGKKHQSFNGDGTHTTFQLRETGIGSVDQVYVNATLKTVTTDYTVNLTNGTVTFVTAPSNVPDNVDIYWTKGTGQRDYIEKCRFSMDYSGQTDTRVFLWGNTDIKNRRFWSGIANGMPSAEYFEANSYDDLGTGQYAITDIVKQYDRQKIFLEDRTMYSYYETQIIGDVTTATFPVFELNEEIGNVAFNQVQVVENSPLALYQGIHAFKSSTVRDQTNQDLISQRIQDSFISKDLTTAITTLWQKKSEYWCNIGNIVYVNNFINNTWYTFNNITATCFLEVNGELYFGTNGSIEKFDDLNLTDNGNVINATWEMGFYDFDAEWLTKYMNNVWVSIAPQPNNRIDLRYVTNEEPTSDSETIRYQLFTFQHTNFSDFSFNTSYNPQPFYVSVQAMGFCYFKIILENKSLTETATIISVNMPVKFGGRVD